MRPSETHIVARMLEAYRQGLFPMADGEPGELNWYSPNPRAVVPIEAAPGEPGGVKYPRSLRSRVRSGKFTITTDRAFEWVISACAEPRKAAARPPEHPGMREGLGAEQDATWIDEQIIGLYTLLHRAGHAHSVEAWLDQSEPDGKGKLLVGGLYGVHIGGAFFGESMFSRPEQGGTDSSKVCFIRLVEHLRARGFTLLDTQFANPHMERLGIVEIPRREYLKRLKAATARDVAWLPWTGPGLEDDGRVVAPA